MKITSLANSRPQGFTLIEITIVLFIVALLLGGLLPTLSGQIEQRRVGETSKQLEEIQQALIGFAIVNGRLPCPASSTTSGAESPSTGTGICTNNFDGYVPAATLGVTTTVDSQGNTGFAVDSWGNRIRYAVTAWSSNTYTVPNGMSTKGITNLIPPDLIMCSTATGIGVASCATGKSLSSNGVPVVIFSTGKNGLLASPGLDEAANLNGTNDNNDRAFVSHTPTPTGSTNGEFDDLVIWLSPNTLINRMVAAGRLP